uniref:Uncharacterized protein n=1 Tax=Globodera rostochiensis TaxID=31243 RepID=A0A914H8V0_GLORO
MLISNACVPYLPSQRKTSFLSEDGNGMASPKFNFGKLVGEGSGTLLFEIYQLEIDDATNVTCISNAQFIGSAVIAGEILSNDFQCDPSGNHFYGFTRRHRSVFSEPTWHCDALLVQIGNNKGKSGQNGNDAEVGEVKVFEFEGVRITPRNRLHVDIEFKFLSDNDGIFILSLEIAHDHTEASTRSLWRSDVYKFTLDQIHCSVCYTKIDLSPPPTRYSEIFSNFYTDTTVYHLDWRIHIMLIDDVIVFYNTDERNRVYLSNYPRHRSWTECAMHAQSDLKFSHFGRSSFLIHFDNGFLIQKILQNKTVYRAFIDTVTKTIRYKQLFDEPLYVFANRNSRTIASMCSHDNILFISIDSPPPLKHIVFWHIVDLMHCANLEEPKREQSQHSSATVDEFPALFCYCRRMFGLFLLSPSRPKNS